jgi:hypothetical protein
MHLNLLSDPYDQSAYDAAHTKWEIQKGACLVTNTHDVRCMVIDHLTMLADWMDKHVKRMADKGDPTTIGPMADAIRRYLEPDSIDSDDALDTLMEELFADTDEARSEAFDAEWPEPIPDDFTRGGV